MPSLNLIDKAFFLKKSSLFGALDLDLLLSIADKMEMVHFRATEFVFQLNQEAHRMYLIVSGQLIALDQANQPLADLLPGDFFGEEALFNEKKRAYYVVCKSRVELLTLSRTHLLSIINECPSIALFLLESYTAHTHFRAR